MNNLFSELFGIVMVSQYHKRCQQISSAAKQKFTTIQYYMEKPSVNYNLFYSGIVYCHVIYHDISIL